MKLLINAKAENEISKAEKKSLISLPHTKTICWRKKPVQEDSELHISQV